VEDAMRIEERITEALAAELKRQATEPTRQLSFELKDPPDALINNGRVDLDKLAMVVLGAMAGGP
jgi:hypothetical protein